MAGGLNHLSAEQTLDLLTRRLVRALAREAANLRRLRRRRPDIDTTAAVRAFTRAEIAVIQLLNRRRLRPGSVSV
jgi:hypothetical protein